jgi:hypothetical protein
MKSRTPSKYGNFIVLMLVLTLGSSCSKLLKSASSASNASSSSGSGGGGGTSPTPTPTPAPIVLEGYEPDVVRALSVSRIIHPGYTGPLIRVKAVAAGAEQDISADAVGNLDEAALNVFALKYSENILISKIYDQRNVALTAGLKGDRYGYSNAQMPVIVKYSSSDGAETRALQINPSTGRIAARFSLPEHRLATDSGFLPTGTYDIHLVIRSENAKAIFYIAGLNQYAFKINPSYTTPVSSDLNTVVFRNWDVSTASFLIDAGTAPINLANYSQSSMSAVLTQGAGNQFKVFSMLRSSPDSFFGNKADFGGYKNYSPGDNFDFLGYYEEEVIMKPMALQDGIDLANRLVNY